MTTANRCLSLTGAGVLVGVLVLAALPANAQRGARHWGGSAGFGEGMALHAGRMAARLDLSDAQRERIKALREKLRDSTQDVREQMKSTRQELRKAMEEGNRSQIELLSEREGALAGKLRVAALAAREEFQSILTPEQRQKLEEARKPRSRSWREARPQRRGL